MPTMVLTKSCKVGSVRRSPGFRFDVPDKEARLWMALSRAKQVEEPRQQPEQQAAPAAATGSRAAARPERRGSANRYHRTDMRAED